MKKLNSVLILFSFILVIAAAVLSSCAPASVVITYDANGGVFSNGTDELVLEKPNGAHLVEPVSPIKTGHFFVGWSTTVDGKNPWDFSENVLRVKTTLYAVWEAVEAKVTAAVGGEIDASTITLSVGVDKDSLSLSDIISVSKGASWTLSRDTLGNEVMNNKIAGGLTTGENTFYLTVTAKDSVASATYTLKIVRESSVSVTLNPLEGTLSDTESSIPYNSSYTLPVPVREGHTFLGWLLDGTPITDGEGASLAVSDITEPVELCASWEKNIYSVIASVGAANAGSVSGGGQLEYGEATTVTASANLGYRFLGWYDGENNFLSSAVSYSFSVSESVSYVAKFEVRPEMSAFTFTSTGTSCVITGLTDNTVSEILIPEIVTEIAAGALAAADDLDTVKYNGTRAKWASVAKSSSDFESLTVTCNDDQSSGGSGGGNLDNGGWTGS